MLLEGTPASWEAAYSAIHLAARLASRLVGVAGVDAQDERSARQWLAEFETGGRAAGIAVETHLLARLDLDSVLAQAETSDGAFVGRRGDEPPDMLNALFDSLTTPLWVVPRQVSVRRMAYLGGSDMADSASSRFAHSLSRRLGVELTGMPPTGPVGSAPGPSVVEVGARLAEAGADLAVFERQGEVWPARDLCLQPPCLIACVPS